MFLQSSSMTKLSCSLLNVRDLDQEEQEPLITLSSLSSKVDKPKYLGRCKSDPERRTVQASASAQRQQSEAIDYSNNNHIRQVTLANPMQEQVGQNRALEHIIAVPSSGPSRFSGSEYHGYVMDLLAESPKPPIQDQPGLSYFSYLGRDNPRLLRAQYQARENEATDWQNFTEPGLSGSNTALEVQKRATVVHYKKREVNFDKWIDCCTCMCCVKGLFYHCTKDSYYEGDVSRDPCSCQEPGSECLRRWSILGAFSLFMPCLLCYPLFQAAQVIQEKIDV